METEENILEKTIKLLAISNQQLKLKDWSIYLSRYDKNGWVLPHFLPNARLLKQSMHFVKLDFDKVKNYVFDSEDEKKENLNALRKIKSLKEAFVNELLELLPLSNDSNKNKVLYNDVVSKLKISNELFDLVRTRLERSGMPEIIDNGNTEFSNNLVLNNLRDAKADSNVKNLIKDIETNELKSNSYKMTLRLSQYELALILETLRSMKFISDYVGKKFDAKFCSFIENNFECLTKRKDGFTIIKNFQGIISKVTRPDNTKTNENHQENNYNIIEEAYKGLGIFKDNFLKAQIPYKKEKE